MILEIIWLLLTTSLSVTLGVIYVQDLIDTERRERLHSLLAIVEALNGMLDTIARHFGFVRSGLENFYNVITGP